MTPEREDRYRRAREVMADAGWLFDDFVNQQMRNILVSRADESAVRDEAYRRAAVAAELKLRLESEVKSYEADLAREERQETAIVPVHMRRATNGR